MATMTKSELLTLIRETARTSIATTVGDEIERRMAPFRTRVKSSAPGFLEALAEPLPASESGIGLGQAARAVAFAKMSGTGPAGAAQWAAKEGYAALSKALSSSDGTSGGFLIPIQMSTDIITFLRPASVMRKMNPMILPMPTGTMRIPKVATGAAASYISENTNIGVTAPSFGQIVLSWKKLAALVPISNDLIRYSSPAADAVVRDDVVRAMAQAENLAFLRGDGTANSPKGLRYWINAANVLTSAGTTLANMTTDIGAMILALLNNNVPMTRPAWLMSPRSWNALNLAQTTTGAFAFRAEMANGTLMGFPFAFSTHVPGAGATGELYLADFADVVIGESLNLIVDASAEAAYYDGSQVIASFSQDQTVIRVIAEHDFALRRDVSAAVMTAMSW